MLHLDTRGHDGTWYRTGCADFLINCGFCFFQLFFVNSRSLWLTFYSIAVTYSKDY